ncbi:MAG: tetratricopeptide repeat protein [Oligoflexales bacterium]|nr:tetratricopeptide repeat protein [Oligoflexales bacterium]
MPCYLNSLNIVMLFASRAERFTPKTLRKSLVLARRFLIITALGFIAFQQNSLAATEDLETEAWISDDSELISLENKIVREIQKNPKSAYHHYVLSHTYVRIFALNPSRLDLLQKASALAVQAIQLAPNEEFGYLALADIMDIMGKSDHGMAILSDAKAKLKADPSWRFEFTKARLSAAGQDFNSILDSIDSCLTRPATKKDIVIPYVITILQANYENERLQNALATWNKKHPHPLFDLMQAVTLTELQQYEKAHKIYAQLRKADPKFEEAIINDAVLLYKHLGKPELARRLLNEALNVNSGSDDVFAVIHAHLGSVELAAKNFELAKKHYVTSITSTSHQVLTVEYILNIYKENEAYSQLAKVLEDIVIELPGHAELYALLGELYSEKLEKHELAAKSYKNAAILSPDNGQFLTSLGLIYYKMKSYHKAIRAFDDAVRVNPDDSIALYNKACVLALTNRSDEALIVLNKAIQLNPSLQKMAQEDNDFINVKDLPHFRLITHEQNWNKQHN